MKSIRKFASCRRVTLAAVRPISSTILSVKRPLVSAATRRNARHPQHHHRQLYSRPFSTGKMAIESIITPEVLADVQSFWFEHLSHQDELVIAGDQAAKRWFFGGPEMDQLCASRYGSTLEAIKSSGVTSGKQILDAVQPSQPCDWLSLILLLDQMPRNCYRGASASTVFTFFDPLALHIAQAAIAQGIPDAEPQLRWQFAYRTWFYMPLQHSEDAKVHEQAMQEFQLASMDIQSLTTKKEKDEEWDEYKKKAWEVVHKDIDAARGFARVQIDFQKRHTVLIERFGRYPHRNETLGREFTAEEKEHLEGGGDTFGAKTNDR